MSTGSHQIPRLAEEASDRDVLRHRGEPDPCHGKSTVGEALTLKMQHEQHTDVMHVMLCDPAPDDRIDVIEVGESLGFPGQILARVNLDRRVVYGVTILRYSSFKRRIMWHYHMASTQRALLFLIKTLCAGLRMDEHDHQLSLTGLGGGR